MDWFKDRGLEISVAKSYVMVIKYGRTRATLKPLTLNGEEIPFVDKIKYLGVTIDNKLSWRQHINERLAKAKRDLLTARRLIHTNWGLTPERSKWLYEAIVRPSLDYAAHVWMPLKPQKWLIKDLDKVQRLALVNITSCISSTPTRALERLCNIPPLHLHLKNKAATTVARIYELINRSNWDGLGNTGRKGHLLKWKEYLGPSLPPTGKLCILNLYPFKTTMNTIPLGHVNVFTDGSKIEGRTGLGWAITKNDAILREGYNRLPNYCSVFIAELMAIDQAVRALLELHGEGKLPRGDINFYIDNQAAIKTLNKTKMKGQVPIRVRNTVIDAETVLKTKFSFSWVKGHNDSTGNEFADSLAKQGTLSNDLIQLKPDISHIKSEIKAKVYKEWDREWATLSDCRQSRELITFTAGQNNSNQLLGRGRKDCRRMVALLTGHNMLRYHLFNQYVGTNPNFSPCCRLCKTEVETSWHLMYECPSLESKRREAAFSPEKPKKGPDIDFEGLRRWAKHLGLLEMILDGSQSLELNTD